MNSKAWGMLLGVCLAAGVAAAPLMHANSDEMEADVSDAFGRATMIVQGLETMSTAAEPYAVQERSAAMPHGHAVKVAAAKAVKVEAAPAQAWAGRHIGPIERKTVFAVFQITVDETSPTSFDVSVISSDFCEEVVVKDRHTQKILAKQSKDDEKLFKVSIVGHALTDDIELSIAVLDPNDSNSLHYAAVPVLGGTDLKVNP
jgi:hypothetical protein